MRKHLAFRPEAITTPTMTDYRTYLQQDAWSQAELGQSYPDQPQALLCVAALQDTSGMIRKSGQARSERKFPHPVIWMTRKNRPARSGDGIGKSTGSCHRCPPAAYGTASARTLHLTRAHVRLGKRSGTILVLWQGQQVSRNPSQCHCSSCPLAYDPSLTKPHSDDPTPLFLSEKRHAQLTGRGLGYLVKKYAERAHSRCESP